MTPTPNARLSGLTFAIAAMLAFPVGLPAYADVSPSQVAALDIGDKPLKSPSASDYLERADVQAFLAEVHKTYKIPMAWLEDEVAVARYSETAERLMTPKARDPIVRKDTPKDKKVPKRDFSQYAKPFLSAERIARGQEFMARNKAVFDEIDKTHGVPRHVITAVIGVETMYGRNMGRYRVLDSLMTLSFDYTRRATFFKKELATFLDFCWRQEISPVTVLGSFAGAIGYGQFMPSSVDRWGLDGDKDGKIDLIGNEADAIASVANFLVAHGWTPGRGVLYTVTATEDIFEATGSGGIEAHTTVGDLAKAGVKLYDHFPLPEDEPVLLVDLPQRNAKGHLYTKWYLGTRNFSAILRYNRSYFYAAAVTLLADRIAKAPK